MTGPCRKCGSYPRTIRWHAEGNKLTHTCQVCWFTYETPALDNTPQMPSPPVVDTETGSPPVRPR